MKDPENLEAFPLVPGILLFYLQHYERLKMKVLAFLINPTQKISGHIKLNL